MTFTISDLKGRLNSKVHNSINKVQDVAGLILEAGNNIMLEIDLPDTIRVAALQNAIYDDVDSYAAPADLKDDRIISLIPQVNATPMQNYNQTYSKAFDLRKDLGDMSVEMDSGVKTISISPIGQKAGATLSTADSLSDNGTWTAGGNAINLEADQNNFVSGSASLKFDISASGSAAYVENSTLSAVDASEYEDTGSLFVWAYVPSVSIISSIEARWGSSSSDYNSRTVSATHDNTAFVVGWNLLRFDWAGSSETGTNAASSQDYLRVTFNYDGTATQACRIDSAVFRLGSIFNLRYYSSYLYRSTAGTWLPAPTAVDDSDIINVSQTGEKLFIAELNFLAAQEIGAQDAAFDVAYFEKMRNAAFQSYGAKNKSQALKRRESYYRPYSRRRR
jgi:hypothetical protein